MTSTVEGFGACLLNFFFLVWDGPATQSLWGSKVWRLRELGKRFANTLASSSVGFFTFEMIDSIRLAGVSL